MRILFLHLILLFCAGCGGIFITDPVDPRLPMYTESGHNVAGALINNTTWKARQTSGWLSGDDVRLQKYSNDSLVFSIIGAKHFYKGENQVDSTFTTQLYFSFYQQGINALEALSVLEGRIIALDGQQNYGAIQYHTRRQEFDCTYLNGTGQLFFKRIQIDTERKEAIVSGTFGFTHPETDCEPIEVYYGRFDFRLSLGDNLYIAS